MYICTWHHPPFQTEREEHSHNNADKSFKVLFSRNWMLCRTSTLSLFPGHLTSKMARWLSGPLKPSDCKKRLHMFESLWPDFCLTKSLHPWDPKGQLLCVSDGMAWIYKHFCHQCDSVCLTCSWPSWIWLCLIMFSLSNSSFCWRSKSSLPCGGRRGGERRHSNVLRFDL